MRLQSIPFRLESEIVRFFYRVTQGRPSSRPFLSGDGYRALASHRFETETTRRFRPETVHAGDIVFCEAWKLREFFEGPARAVNKPFVLLSSNGDVNVGRSLIDARPPSVGAWFAQNLAASDTSAEVLPIGLENRSLHCNGVPRDFRQLDKRPQPKVTKILYGFAVSTNPNERTAAVKALEASPLAEALPYRLNARAYRKALSRYRFVASPEGNGLDCHRTWEAMYLRVVPIVHRSLAIERFANLGLPLLVVDDWSEVLQLTEGELEILYREREPGFDHAALWLDYWQAAIQAASDRLK